MLRNEADKRKENLLAGVSNVCRELDILRGSDSPTFAIMPLLYLLVTHHHGKRFEVNSPNFSREHFLQMPLEYDFDEQSQDLLYRIGSQFPNLINRHISYSLADFYAKYSEMFEEFYIDIIEHIIEHLATIGGRASALYTSSKAVTKLLHHIVMKKKPNRIYDPCAGLCSIAMLPGMDNIPFQGQEINKHIAILAAVRLDAHNRSAKCETDDCINHWEGDFGCDCLCTDPPLGYRIENSHSRYGRDHMILEDFLIERFIESPTLNQAVFIVTAKTCQRKANFHLRKTLCERNYVDMVIELPKGAMPSTGIVTEVLVLDKNRTEGNIRFISAADCLIQSSRFDKSLDLDTIYKRIAGKDKTQSAIVNNHETFKNDCDLTPYTFIKQDVTIAPGQKLVKLSSVASLLRPTTSVRSSVDFAQGIELTSGDLSASLPEFKMKSFDFNQGRLSEKRSWAMVNTPCVIFDSGLQRFYIKSDYTPIYFIASSFHAFEIDIQKCSPEYFVYLLLNSEILKTLRSRMLVPHLTSRDFRSIQLPMYEDAEAQKNIVARAYRETERELQSKIAKLQVLGDRSSGLLHNLGVTFNGLGATVANMRALLSDEAKAELYCSPGEYDFMPISLNEDLHQSPLQQLASSVESLNDTIKYALRLINSAGADYALVKPRLEILDIEETVDKYVKAWKHFGYHSFSVNLDTSCLSSSEATMLKIDVEMFYTLLDCILTNAHQHGFSRKASDDNMVSIELKPVIVSSGDDENIATANRYLLISVANNGKPLPEGFTLKDFITRGVVGVNSSQDGLGGDHISKIVKHFNGLLDIDSTAQWLSFNVLLPIYITPNDTEFEVYECKTL